MLTERPVPGQSLTTPPKSAPYERPPETVDALDALSVHIDNLEKSGAMEAIINMIESDIDLVTIIESLLRSAVMEGIHSIDISILIAPLLHAYIKGELDALGIDYDEGFEDKAMGEAVDDQAIGAKILKRLRMSGDIQPRQEPMQEEAIQEEPMEQELPAGLMART